MSKEIRNRILTPGGNDIRQLEDTSHGWGIFLSRDGVRFYSVFKPTDMMEFAVVIRDIKPDNKRYAFILSIQLPAYNSILDLKITVPEPTEEQRKKGLQN